VGGRRFLVFPLRAACHATHGARRHFPCSSHAAGLLAGVWRGSLLPRSLLHFCAGTTPSHLPYCSLPSACSMPGIPAFPPYMRSLPAGRAAGGGFEGGISYRARDKPTKSALPWRCTGCTTLTLLWLVAVAGHFEGGRFCARSVKLPSAALARLPNFTTCCTGNALSALPGAWGGKHAYLQHCYATLSSTNPLSSTAWAWRRRQAEGRPARSLPEEAQTSLPLPFSHFASSGLPFFGTIACHERRLRWTPASAAATYLRACHARACWRVPPAPALCALTSSLRGGYRLLRAAVGRGRRAFGHCAFRSPRLHAILAWLPST